MRRTDIDLRRIGGLAGALLLVIALAIGSVFLLLRHWGLPGGGAAPGSAELQAIPGPRLQAAPQDDLARFRAAQNQALTSIEWVDEARGIVRIPVADAMALAARGQGVRGGRAAP